MSLALILGGLGVAIVGGAFVTAWLLPRAMPEPAPVDVPTDEDPAAVSPTDGYDIAPSSEVGYLLGEPAGHRVRRPAPPGASGASWPPTSRAVLDSPTDRIPAARAPHPSEHRARHAAGPAADRIRPYLDGRGGAR